MLRPVQVDAYKALKGFFTKTHPLFQGYFEIATGIGKTRLFLLLAMKSAALMKNAQCHFPQRNILIIAPNIQLSTQTYEDAKVLAPALNFDFTKFILIHSDAVKQEFLARNKFIRQNPGNVVIMCEKSAKKLFSDLPEAVELFGLTIVDEFHSANGFLLKFLKEYGDTSKTYLLGFSATPNEENIPYMGERVMKYSAQQGVQDGNLVPWVIDTFPYPLKNNEERFRRELPELLTSRYHAHGGTLAENHGLIFTSSIAEANAIHRELKSHKIPSKAIHSGYLSAQNKKRVKKYKEGIVKILIVVDMFTQGVDLLQASWTIIGKEILQQRTFVQLLGRLLRCNPEQPNKIANILVFQDALVKAGIADATAYYDSGKLLQIMEKNEGSSHYLSMNRDLKIKMTQQIEKPKETLPIGNGLKNMGPEIFKPSEIIRKRPREIPDSSTAKKKKMEALGRTDKQHHNIILKKEEVSIIPVPFHWGIDKTREFAAFLQNGENEKEREEMIQIVHTFPWFQKGIREGTIHSWETLQNDALEKAKRIAFLYEQLENRMSKGKGPSLSMNQLKEQIFALNSRTGTYSLIHGPAKEDKPDICLYKWRRTTESGGLQYHHDVLSRAGSSFL